MKFKIEKQKLENLLVQMQPFTEKKDTSQITSHILVEVKENSLALSATNYELGLRNVVEVEVERPGTTTVNAKKFLDVVKPLKSMLVTIELKENSVFVSQKSSRYKLPIFNHEEFPIFPKVEDANALHVELHMMMDSLRKITPSIDTNNPKFELNGAVVEIKENEITFASTDTRRLSVVQKKMPSDQVSTMLIPKTAITEMQKLEYEDVKMICSETEMMLVSNTKTFFTKLINGKFPEYQRIIPKEIAEYITLEKKTMIDAIKMIAVVSHDIKLTFNNTTLVVEAMTTENIDAKTEVALLTPVPSITIAVNSRYLLDFLQAIKSDTFTLGYNELNLPFTLEADGLKTVVMPIVI